MSAHSRGNVEILNDLRAGSEARVLPGFGFNCYRFQAVIDEKPYEILHSEPGFEDGQGKPSHNGVPVLFPFPNRIRQGRFTFAGKNYTLPAGDPLGNAIHGFVIERPWRVTGRGDLDGKGQWIEGTFHAGADAPELLRLWPADFRISLRYTLRGNELACRIRIDNPDDKPLPFGFGTHPYFRLPLSEAGDEGRCRVYAPASAQWVLEDFLPTGEVRPVPDAKDLRDGRLLSELRLDDVFSELAFQNGRATCRLVDEVARVEVVQEFDRFFRELVIYNPPHRRSISLEPYTCTTDAINLHSRGVDAGLRVLQPGEEATGEIVLRASAIA
jgi:aldose 1-epimerase